MRLLRLDFLRSSTFISCRRGFAAVVDDGFIWQTGCYRGAGAGDGLHVYLRQRKTSSSSVLRCARLLSTSETFIADAMHGCVPFLPRLALFFVITRRFVLRFGLTNLMAALWWPRTFLFLRFRYHDVLPIRRKFFTLSTFRLQHLHWTIIISRKNCFCRWRPF